MSSINYSLNHKGVRLIPRVEAWVKAKNGKRKLNPKYNFIGRIDTKTHTKTKTRLNKWDRKKMYNS